MTEEKQNKINEIIDDKRPRWLTALRVVVICIIAVLLVVVGLIAFLQLTTFDMVQKQIAPETFVAEARQSLTYSSDGFVITVPEEVISYELQIFLAEVLQKKDVVLESLYYNGEEQKVYTNLSYMGFYVPVSLSLRFQQINTGFTVAYDDMRVSNREWSFGDAVQTFLTDYLELSEERQTIDIYGEGVNELLVLMDISHFEGQMVLTLDVDDDRIESEVDTIRGSLDPLLLEHYKTYSDGRTAPVLDIINRTYPLTPQQEQQLISDAMEGQFLLSDMLLLTNGYNTDSLHQLMADYGLSVDTGKIDLERKAFKGQAIDSDIAKVFVALDTHFGETIMAFNQGKPFDIENMTTMTVGELIGEYDLLIDETIAKDMFFVYDDAFKVAYKLDETAYYVRGIENYEVLDAATVKAMPGGSYFVKPNYTDDPVLWQQTIDFLKGYFSVDEIFVRYMKSDEQSIFTVISNGDNPQDYWAMALMTNDGTFTVLEENVKSIVAMITEHPEFNIETATKEVETVEFERISEDIQAFIIDELYDLRKISSKRDTEIVYSSYDGKTYIAFKLNNGDEYVYKVEGTVYGTYLATVYTKDKAVRNWSDISELLLLQDAPD